jgi:hypothetical protein
VSIIKSKTPISGDQTVRCPKCKKEFKPYEKNQGQCPWCGHQPTRWQRWWQSEKRAEKILFFICCIFLPLAGLLSGQILITGTILALILGGFLVHSGLKTDFSNLENPGMARGISIAFGSVSLLGGIAALIWLFRGAPIPGWEEMGPVFSAEALIAFGIVMGFSLGAGALKKVLERRLTRRIRKNETGGRAFRIPSFFTSVLLMVILILIPLLIFLPVAWLNRANSAVGAGLGLGVPALMSPLLLFAVLMVRHNFGAVVITSRKITRYYLFTKKCVPLSDITRINVRVFGLPPALAVRSAGKRITFPRSIQGYPELLKILRLYTGLSTRKPAKKSVRAGPPLRFPYTLRIAKGRMALEVIAMLLLIIIYLGLSLIGLWIPLLQGTIPPFTGDDLLGIGVLFTLISLIFIPILILAGKESFDRKKPLRFLLTKDHIQITYPLDRKTVFPAKSLEKVWLQPVAVPVRSSYQGAVVRGKTTIYNVCLRFAGGKEIVLKPSRVRLFQLSPEETVEIFETLYSLEP